MASVVPDPRRIKRFENESAFEAWLSAHHDSEPEVWIKIHKKSSGLPSVTPAQALDVVLCWGWIDGLRKVFDARSFLGVGAQIQSEVARRAAHTGWMKSRVHPTYKTRYHLQNWGAYDRALVRRGDITVWLSPEAVAAWEPDGDRTRGAQRKYSDVAIETALTMRLLFHLPLRQAEGFLTSLFVLMGLDLRSPDHTTLSRRGQHLDLTLRGVPRRTGLHLIIDSTGLSIVGQGEWAAAKHGGRGQRGWRKLHLGVDRTGVIVAHALTEATVDDASTGRELIAAVDEDLARVTADAAYDTIAFYDAASARGAVVVVPPAKTATVSGRGPRSSQRDRTITRVKRVGRRAWQKISRYHQQARVENAFFRYKSIIGDGLRARTPDGRTAEAQLACNILNAMTELGRPDSYAIGR